MNDKQLMESLAKELAKSGKSGFIVMTDANKEDPDDFNLALSLHANMNLSEKIVEALGLLSMTLTDLSSESLEKVSKYIQQLAEEEERDAIAQFVGHPAVH